MSDINFHKPYKGRENNKYTFLIQKLYNYQYTLQEITKELQKILKQMPEYKNKNKANINLEINKITNSINIKKHQYGSILQKFQQKKARGEPLLNIEDLFKVRKIILEHIKILEEYISQITVPQNNRFSNNLEENYNEPLTKSKPKSETKYMTENEKIKAQSKEAEKLLSKKYRKANLVKNTYLANKELSNEFMSNAFKKEESELEKEQWHYFLLNVDPEYRRQFKINNNNFNNNDGNSNNEEQYNSFIYRPGPIAVRGNRGQYKYWNLKKMTADGWI